MHILGELSKVCNFYSVKVDETCDLSEATTLRGPGCPRRLFVLLVGQKYIYHIREGAETLPYVFHRQSLYLTTRLWRGFHYTKKTPQIRFKVFYILIPNLPAYPSYDIRPEHHRHLPCAQAFLTSS